MTQPGCDLTIRNVIVFILYVYTNAEMIVRNSFTSKILSIV